MKYLLLIYGNPTWSARSDEQRRQLDRDHAELLREITESGEWLDGAPLTDSAETRTVRTDDGGTIVTDGPYGEAKEYLAGYDVIDCAGIDRAAEIARRIHGGAAVVRIRPIADMPPSADPPGV
ncbi:YciI family protein [Kutzneria sp. NPDC052558]|uniref:YciI family protein n=1 Tax=Kutzneria sp. NPDC052558 TaxID=3364121 RepID=UPI0037CA80D3